MNDKNDNQEPDRTPLWYKLQRAERQTGSRPSKRELLRAAILLGLLALAILGGLIFANLLP